MPRMTPPALFIAALLLSLLLGCGRKPPECEGDCAPPPEVSCGDGVIEGEEACDDGNLIGADGCEADCTLSPGTEELCPSASLPPPPLATCEVTPGDQNRLITGVVLTPGKVLRGGQVLFDGAGQIQCVGCDCSGAPGAASATRLTCPRGVLSPGLINSHDHLSFQAAPYTTSSTERYEHRHDWRKGNDGHTAISAGSGSAAQMRWAELRQVMAGTTSIAGSNGQGGLLRNLDAPSTSASGASQEGLGEGARGVRYQTFPLGDSAGTELTSGCAYPGIDSPSVIPTDAAYLPHIAEGIEASARNEFLCLSGGPGGQDLIGPRTAIIHGVGLKAAEVAVIAAEGASLIWSPRSNVMLYGDTSPIGTYARLGVNIALGTDWVRSGSMNLLRELRCADALNAGYFDRVLGDDQLWRTVTSQAAMATKTSEKIGLLAAGKVADIAIFRQRGEQTYRSVLEADPQDVVLTLRGGKVLYGDQVLVNALSPESCNPLEVCGAQKAVCLLGELGETLPQLEAANASTYPLFFCGAPRDEPSCLPQRAEGNSKSGSTLYSGAPAESDLDGDGLADGSDNCPRVFNPIRPMDEGRQADGDADGLGDVCDSCPLNAGSSCRPPDPNDRDGDGLADGSDNCPSDFNPGQSDGDTDGKGDACDACPAPNPGLAPCPATIYAIKAPAGALLGQKVSLGNVLVTAVGRSGFFVQVHEDEAGYQGANYSGLFVYFPSPTVSAGDRVDIAEASVADYFGQVELSGVTSVAVASSGRPVPAPVSVAPEEIATGGARAKELEGVLVRVSSVTVTSLAPTPGPGDSAPTNEFEVGSGLRVNDYLYLTTPLPSLGEGFGSITGVAQLRNGNHKLEPRGLTDLVGAQPALASFGPSPTFLRVGTSGSTFPQPLAVTLRRVQAADTTVQLGSSSPDLAVADLLIPAGQLSSPVSVSGVAQNPAVTVTASAGASSLQAAVRVLAPAEPATLVALEPAVGGVPAGGKLTLTVRMDLPPPGDTAVTLSVSPPSGFATVPASVTVPANQLSQAFELLADPAAQGSGTVTAQLGSVSLDATVNILPPGADHLVISELAVQGTGGANDEFVELYNPTSAAVSLGGWKLQYMSATGSSYGNKATLPQGASIAPRGYFLIAGSGYTGTVAPDYSLGLSSLSVAWASGHLRIGKPGVGTAVTDANAVDTLAYGSTASHPEKAPAPALSSSSDLRTFERKARASSSSASMEGAGSDASAGNGHDSDDNSADFLLRSAREPQNAQSPPEP